MAPETILMMQNSTIFTDDNIGNRLGLVPFRMDARKFKFRPTNNRSDQPEYAAVFNLQITPTKSVALSKSFQTRNAPKLPNVNVYSGDLKWQRLPAHKKDMRDWEMPRPVSDKILLATLLAAQELTLRVHVVKGIGKDHAKFSPVSTATFRPVPDVRLLRPVRGAEAEKLQGLMTRGVIAVSDKPGTILCVFCHLLK